MFHTYSFDMSQVVARRLKGLPERTLPAALTNNSEERFPACLILT